MLQILHHAPDIQLHGNLFNDGFEFFVSVVEIDRVGFAEMQIADDCDTVLLNTTPPSR
ncbi:hypothetical protein [uncultured Tateyamaria sp.]|uniref:hypothetical protein n=1 Tax=uncultured Tateyamaria sp. TaxID=455651 RepID=UPI00261FBFCC|nr:hypothetical protein [uncultured Tateyamaria sp.]